MRYYTQNLCNKLLGKSIWSERSFNIRSYFGPRGYFGFVIQPFMVDKCLGSNLFDCSMIMVQTMIILIALYHDDRWIMRYPPIYCTNLHRLSIRTSDS